MQSRDENIGELLAELSQNTAGLVQNELRLVEAEMTQKAYRAGKDAGMLAAGGALAYTGLLASVAGTILLFGKAVPPWVSATLVGTTLAGAGGILAAKGLEALKQEDVVPRETVETLKEDTEWLKNRTG